MRANGASRVAAGIALVALACAPGCDSDGLGGLFGYQVGIVNPRAGEVYDPGSTISVAWIGIWQQQVVLEFSSDGGATWTTLNGGIPVAGLNASDRIVLSLYIISDISLRTSRICDRE